MAADATKAPLRRAEVTVLGGSLVTRRVTVTDDDGRFVMGGLAAGQYQIAAAKSGYLTVNYGASRPARLGTSVVVAEGQSVTELTIALPRGAAIMGTVTNAAGEEEPDVQVTALHWRMWNGQRTLVPVKSTATDDRGAYRLAGLDRGDYLVSVEPPDASRGPADLIQIADGAVDRALRDSRAGAPAADSVPARRVQALGPAPVFHPGTVRAANAATITLGVGEERDGVDVRTELVPMARIDGLVTDEGQPAAGVQVVLASLGPPAPNFAFAAGARLGPRRTDANGRFSLVGVPPGAYRLEVSTRMISGRAAGAGDASRPRMAFEMLEVNGVDKEVTLPLQPGMSIAGRFVFEGTGVPPQTSTGTHLTLQGLQISPGWEVDVYRADAASDGSFAATGLTPGRYLLNATVSGSTAASGWAVKSISHRGRDLLASPFELAPGEILTDVVVTFTDQPAELAGTLQNSSGIPTTDYFIVVFSPESKYWFASSRYISSVRPNTTGAYTIRNLPPGEYFLAAVTDVETGEWFDPAFLRVLADAKPLRISIRDGQVLRQDLRIGK